MKNLNNIMVTERPVKISETGYATGDVRHKNTFCYWNHWSRISCNLLCFCQFANWNCMGCNWNRKLIKTAFLDWNSVPGDRLADKILWLDFRIGILIARYIKKNSQETTITLDHKMNWFATKPLQLFLYIYRILQLMS